MSDSRPRVIPNLVDDDDDVVVLLGSLNDDDRPLCDQMVSIPARTAAAAAKVQRIRHECRPPGGGDGCCADNSASMSSILESNSTVCSSA